MKIYTTAPLEDPRKARTIYKELEAQGKTQLVACGIRSGGRYRRSADMRFTGQGYEIAVDLPEGPYKAADVERLRAAFCDAYAGTYGDRAFDRTAPIEIVQFRMTASGPVPEMHRAGVAQGDGSPAAALKGRRPAYFPETRGFVDTPVYDRYMLRAGDRFEGPALVEERESTVVVIPDCTVCVNAAGDIIADLADAKEPA